MITITPPVEAALRRLGFDPRPTPDEVKRAYRQRASAAHPDHGGTADALDELTRARDTVLAWLAEPRRCHDCRGSGRVLEQVGWSVVSRVCQLCRGSGEL